MTNKIHMTKEELYKLKHEWRLKLKESGFEDIELWNNGDQRNVKFIKGHLRYRSQSALQLNQKINETKEFFRIIGLYANHCKTIPFKYIILLQDYAITGNMTQSLRNTKSDISIRAATKYVQSNFPKMIAFVDNEFKDEEDYDRRIN